MFSFNTHWQQLKKRKNGGSVSKIPASQFPDDEWVA